jgi:hypothetical protein
MNLSQLLDWKVQKPQNVCLSQKTGMIGVDHSDLQLVSRIIYHRLTWAMLVTECFDTKCRTINRAVDVRLITNVPILQMETRKC